jgi:hypothetical protein
MTEYWDSLRELCQKLLSREYIPTQQDGDLIEKELERLRIKIAELSRDVEESQ